MPVNLAAFAEGGTTIQGVSTVGSILKVKALTGQLTVPAEITITATSTAAAVTASLTASVAVTLDRGTVLTFTGGTLTLAETKAIATTATTVAVFAAPALTAATTNIWGLVTAPTTDIPGNETVGTVDAKTHEFGEQGAMERVSRAFAPAIPLIVRPLDPAYFQHILPAALNKTGFNGNVYAAIQLNAGGGEFEYVFGRALATITNDPNPINEIRRPTLQLDFQAPWLKTTAYSLEPTPTQDAIKLACALAGLKVPV